jgi:hypothetical protein
MTSLHQQLNDWVRKDGYVSHTAIEKACDNSVFGRYYKISNAERRLRKSESPFVETVYDGKAIIGYKWVKPEYRIERVDNNTVRRVKIEPKQGMLLNLPARVF